MAGKGSMKLSDMFLQNAQNTTVGNMSGKGVVTADPSSNYRLNREIRGLKPGQTLQGEVVGRNGNEVQIKIGDDLILTARMEKELNVEPGKIMTFEVKNNSGGTLALSPLFENMGTDANVLKALDMAGLPVNHTTVRMAEAMMAEGMSIDKASLSNMFKNVMGAPESSPASVVTMTKLGIDITPQNLQQMENYKNLEHQLIKDMTNILNELSFQYDSMVQEGDPKGAIELYRAVISLFTDMDMISQGGENAIASEDAAGAGIKNPLAGTKVQDFPAQPVNQESGKTDLQQQGSTAVAGNASGEAAEAAVIVQGGKGTPGAESQILPSTVREGSSILGILNEQQLQNLVQELRALGLPETFLTTLQQGGLTAEQTLSLIREAIQPEGELQTQTQALLSGKEFQLLLQSEMTRQWFLTPEKVGDKKNVDSLYQRLSSQLSRLNETLANTVKADSPLASSTANLQSNIEFLNQLNQTFTYIQLPLKMSGGKANGDLYVYTNKKSLAQKDGNVSALLHLDMEHLGPVDVYVAMQNQKVSTHFYVESDEILDFIESHISILNERLEKKGYSMSCEMSIKEQNRTVVEEMLHTNPDTVKLTQYSFDARA